MPKTLELGVTATSEGGEDGTIDRKGVRMARKRGPAVGREEVRIDAALAQCEAALLAIQEHLLANESLELLDIAEGFGQLKEHPSVEEFGTAYGGLSSFSGRLAGLAKVCAKAGYRASEALGTTDVQPAAPTLN